jgi:hypothetical protein
MSGVTSLEGSERCHLKVTPHRVEGKGLTKKEPQTLIVQKRYLADGTTTLHLIGRAGRFM